MFSENIKKVGNRSINCNIFHMKPSLFVPGPAEKHIRREKLWLVTIDLSGVSAGFRWRWSKFCTLPCAASLSTWSHPQMVELLQNRRQKRSDLRLVADQRSCSPLGSDCSNLCIVVSRKHRRPVDAKEQLLVRTESDHIKIMEKSGKKLNEKNEIRMRCLRIAHQYFAEIFLAVQRAAMH